jgi:hypothetical protein
MREDDVGSRELDAMSDSPINGIRPVRGRPFVKGQPRPPNAGRRRKFFRPGQVDVLEVLARRGVDPLATLADLLADPKTDPSDRLKAAAALLPYVAEKPAPPRPSRGELLEYVAAARELVETLGGPAEAIATLRLAIVAAVAEAFATANPDRARIAVLLCRALEYLESTHKPALEGTPTVRVLWPFSRHIMGDPPDGSDEPAPTNTK